MPRPRVVLADDHKETAEQLRQPHFDVVAVVGDGSALVSAAAELSPDVIVVDISMPILDGIDAAVVNRQRNPQARIVLVTVHAEPILVDRSQTAGARGYALKDSAGDELVEAIHAALGGHWYVSGHEG